MTYNVFSGTLNPTHLLTSASCCYRPTSVVCLSVCHSTTVSPAKTAELIEMPFGLRTRMGPGNHVLDGGPDLPWEGAIFRGKDVTGHARRVGNDSGRTTKAVCDTGAQPRCQSWGVQ